MELVALLARQGQVVISENPRELPAAHPVFTHAKHSGRPSEERSDSN